MEWLLIFVGFVLIFQIAVFFIIWAKRKKDKRENVLLKYDIRTPADVFRLLQDHSLPEDDRQKIEKRYRGEDTN